MSNTTVKVKIFRYNPDTDLAPTYQTYDVPWTETGNLLQLLKVVYTEMDRTLAFHYYACGYKFCNSCMMTINGLVRQACCHFVSPGDELVVEPMKGYPIIRDLVVDYGRRVSTSDGTYDIRNGATIKQI